MQPFSDRIATAMGEYAPNVVSSIIVLVVGLVIAWLLSALARRIFSHTTLDEKLTRVLRGPGATENVDSARWVSRGVFWVVVAIAILGFFQALGFAPVTAPLTRALEVAVVYVPYLIAGAALAVLAWLVASLVRMVLHRALTAARIDQRLSREPTAETPSTTSTTSIARSIAEAGYWLTWFLFLPAILGALQMEGILGPVQRMVDRILAFLPNVLTAALVVVAAYFVGRIVGGLVTSALSALGLDRLAERIGLMGSNGGAWRYRPSKVLGTLSFVAIMLFAIMEALGLLHFEQLETMMAQMIGLFARIALGLVVIGVGVWLARLASRAILHSGMSNASWLAGGANIAILVLATAMGLQQMGIAREIINLAFGLLLGGIAAAVAIAFGVGGREVAGREVQNWVNHLKSRQQGPRGELPGPGRPVPAH